MVSTIAVATDGSATAGKAVEVARDLARGLDAKLVLISAFTESARKSRSDSIEVQWATSNAARIREILSRAEDELRRGGIDCATRVDEGDAADVVVQLA